nr:MAG: hypothetical protein DIU70_14885 [Bacillota bacterium]
MTYSEAQARAMVRAAVRWAREMPEASEEAIVARVLADVRPSKAPEPPLEVTPEIARWVADDLRNYATQSEQWLALNRKSLNDAVEADERARIALLRRLADWLEEGMRGHPVAPLSMELHALLLLDRIVSGGEAPDYVVKARDLLRQGRAAATQGKAARVEILFACMPDDQAWASQEQEEGGIRGGR